MLRTRAIAFSAILIAISLSGCGKDTIPADGSDGLATLVNVTPEPAGANCSHGGSRVDAGLDTNGNGVLDADEVTSTGYVCIPANGDDGLVTLVSVIPEAAGENCPTGGSKVEAGLDTNGNGVLDPDEVTSISYVCSGPGVLWVEVDTDTQAQPNTGYLVGGAAQVAITLPTDPAVGDIVRVSGVGAGGWTLVRNPGQDILNTGSGTAWSMRGPDRDWSTVASAADGMRLVAAAWYGRLYTSADAGVTWWPSEWERQWSSVASSADGTHLVATVSGGHIYTSSNAGETWAQREAVRDWRSVASSADGMRLVAAVYFGDIYTSSNAGVTWTPRSIHGFWSSVASSVDGMRLVAVGSNDRIHISVDAGVSWTAQESSRQWSSVASSADGMRLVAAVDGGHIYTSSNAGETWAQRETVRDWRSVASSADGMRLVASATEWTGDVLNGRIFTSWDAGETWKARESGRDWRSVASSADGMQLWAAVGTGGHLYTVRFGGAQHESIAIQYFGDGTFVVQSRVGDFLLE